MRRALLFLFPALLLAAEESKELRHTPGLGAAITATEPGRVVLRLQNSTAAAVKSRVARGTIFAGTQDHARLLALRPAAVEVGAGGAAELALPAAALGSGAFSRAQSFVFADEAAAPELGPLLDYCQTHDDLPAATAQLLVLCVGEDVSFPRWKEFLARHPENAAPDEVATAIDALGVLRQLYPQRAFALASDAELKLRALRHPVARLKAMQLYGLSLPAVALPPELGTLLHTKAGDNCPICRQRAQMLPREDGL